MNKSNKTIFCKIILLLVFATIFQTASALYNDIGNDSCLAIYSNQREHNCVQGICETILTFQNSCGSSISDADVGLFIENNLLGKIQFQKVYLWNGSAWNDITATLVSAMDAQNIPIGKTGFTLKFGWKSVSIPTGTRILKVVFKALQPSDGEFIIAARSAGNFAFKSILDPIFRSAFYDFSTPSDYNTFNTTITGGYCTFSTGQLQGYCDTNFLQPSPKIIKWYDVNVQKNANLTKITETRSNETRESQTNVFGFSMKSTFGTTTGLGGYDGNYDMNTFMFDNSATQNLLIYACNEKYSTGNFTTDGNCSLIKTYTPAEVSDTYSWHNFSIDGKVFKDANKLQIIYYCTGCQVNKSYNIGVDTDNNGYSYKSNDGGTSWSLENGEYMVKVKHSASGVMLQYSTDGRAYKYTDGNLLDVNTANEKIKIRANLKRYSTSYDANVDSLDINYSNNKPPNAPILQTVDVNGTNARLKWNASSDDENNTPILYHARIGTCNGCNNILADANTFDLNYLKTNLVGGLYYWSAKGCDDANELPSQTNCGNWASDGNFTIQNQPPATPTLIAEPDHTNISTTDLNWLSTTDPEGNPMRYHLNLIKNSILVGDFNTTSTGYVVSVSAGTYVWKVRACDNNYSDGWNNCSAWSATDTFEIYANNPPSIPTLTNEPDQNNISTIDLNWNASTDTESDLIRYHLNVLKNSTLVNDVNTTNTGYLIAVSTGDYTWRVRACDNNLSDGWNNCSDWSSTDPFIINNNLPPSTPTLISVPDQNNTNPVNFDWNASTDTEGNPIRYHINVIKSAVNVLDANTTDTNYNNFAVSIGIYTWKVRACDNNFSDGWNNCSNWSAVDTFEITTNLHPTTPVLIPEPDQLQKPQTDLNWNASIDNENDPIRYHLNVIKNSTIINDANTTSTGYVIPISSGIYTWRVRACDNYNNDGFNHCSDWSTEDTFVVTNCVGSICVAATVNDVNTQVLNLAISPPIWNGIGSVFVKYYCYDPNGLEDLNRTDLILSGANSAYLTDNNFTITINADTQTWFVVVDINNLIFTQGATQITARCFDDGNKVGKSTKPLTYSPDVKMTINYGAEITHDLKVDLNFTVPATMQFMAFSCDYNNWSEWENYKSVKRNFDMGGGKYGCVPKGEGTYEVYGVFSDGVNTYYGYDTIDAIGIDKNQSMYVAPEESQGTLTTMVTFAPLDFNMGLLVLGIIIVAGAIYYLRKRRMQYGN